MKPKIVILTIESLNERGYGTASLEGQQYFILNALPQETVQALIVKKKSGNYFGIAQTVIQPSPLRLAPLEEHFTSCSPWQILPLLEENQFKQKYIQSLFAEVGVELSSTIYDGTEIDGYTTWNYRNKVEYSFYSQGDDLSLAYFKREGGFGKYAHSGCKLIPDKSNQVALAIVDFLKSQHILAKQLKALVLRFSFSSQTVVAKLFVKDPDLRFAQAQLQQLFDSLPDLLGLQVAYSTHKSPAAVTTQLLHNLGSENITEQILDLNFGYSVDGFFQVNPIVFAQTAQDFRQIIEQMPNYRELTVVDLYAGVGVLGQIVAGQVKSVVAVESFEGVKSVATQNALVNGLNNYDFIELPAEKSLETLAQAQILIVDPPRAGLHPKVIEKILSVLPQTILYLSCNPQTQARDYALLRDKYQISHSQAYNYYPHTPHVEHLLVMQLKVDEPR